MISNVGGSWLIALIDDPSRFRKATELDKIYRIYTEDVYRESAIRLASEVLDSFTIHEAIGYYAGQREKSIILETVNTNEDKVKSLADKVRELTGQKSVLIIGLNGEAKTI